MKSILLHPVYFGPVTQFIAMANAEKIIFEYEDNYQKQTYRNRMYIYGANGKLTLNIPVKHTPSSGHRKYKDVEIENDFKWQQLHWRSLEAAYRSSPFFEFYEDDIQPLYEPKFKYLLDFNYHCLEVISDCLQMDFQFEKTNEYQLNPENVLDLRKLSDAKKAKTIPSYKQVFESKNGFLPNLSILDLLFNEGNNSENYLKTAKLNL
ncbi:MAG TPA: WbqC family protein [Salinimicrobium sp.]|nr:WbqC family protein [Salinimicrobium sp.]